MDSVLLDILYMQYLECNKRMKDMEETATRFTGPEWHPWESAYEEEQAVIKTIMRCGIMEKFIEKIPRSEANYIMECIVEDIMNNEETIGKPLFIPNK